MQKEETKQLLSLLEIAYPNHYKNATEDERRNTLILYYDMFCEYPVSVVVQALKNYIRINQYPPTIAGLSEQINFLFNRQDSAELWNTVKNAICKSAYNSVEEFAKLPPVCQKWAGDHMTLKELSQTDIDTLNTVTRGQFLKTIGSLQQRETAQAALPDKLKDQIAEMASGMKMIGEKHE